MPGWFDDEWMRIYAQAIRQAQTLQHERAPGADTHVFDALPWVESRQEMTAEEFKRAWGDDDV